MVDEVVKTLTRLKQDYPVNIVSSGAKEIQFAVAGIQELFKVSIISGDCIVATDAWHEHVGDADGLNNFLRLLFTGAIQIEVKYRGKIPVAHCVWKVQDGKKKFIASTSSLISPFWKKKSYRRLGYKLPTGEK